MLKVLVVCQYYYLENFQVTPICEQLVQDGFDVTVLKGRVKPSFFEDLRIIFATFKILFDSVSTEGVEVASLPKEGDHARLAKEGGTVENGGKFSEGKVPKADEVEKA